MYSTHTSVAVCPLSFRTDIAVAWLMLVKEMPLTLAILSPSLQTRNTVRHTEEEEKLQLQHYHIFHTTDQLTITIIQLRHQAVKNQQLFSFFILPFRT